MNASEALSLLDSTSSHQRLLGARYFCKQKSPESVHALRKFLKLERVKYVIAALELAVKRNSTGSLPVSDDSNEEEQIEESGDLSKADRQEADKWVGILLHEMDPKVGLITVSAKKEIRDYEGSETKKHLDILNMVLAGFSDLRGSIATPRAEEFDLAKLISDISSHENKKNIEILLNGTRPFLLSSDDNLLRMAISNGIRNALEAVSETLASESPPVICDTLQRTP